MQPASIIFQFTKLCHTILNGIYEKPDDRAQWVNILELLYHLRQELACSMCGQLPLRYYTTKEDCHYVCLNCRNGHALPTNSCKTCREAFADNREVSFEECSKLRDTAKILVNMCQLIMEKKILDRWSNLQVGTQDIQVTLAQLVNEFLHVSSMDGQPKEHLGHKFIRKKHKERQHFCRCGSGNKRIDGKSTGNLTCLGQRCACYKEGKPCTNCRCVGCRNPNNNMNNNPNNNPSAVVVSKISPHRP